MDPNTFEASHSALLVEWMEGASTRYGAPPEVLIDGRIAGAVDVEIRVTPGPHQIAVRHGFGQAPTFQGVFHPDRLTVLDYRGGAIRVDPVILFGILELLGITAIHEFFKSWGPASTFLSVITLVAANAAVFIVLYVWGIPGMRGTLQLYTPEIEAEFVPAVATPSAQRPQLHRLRSGRVLIDLVMPPVRGIQPPRPHVFIDGERRGNVERVFRVAAGEHTVQIKGWFDRSDAVSIMVPAGELVQLEVEQTRLAYWLMAVIATSALVAFLAIPTFDLLESGVRIFFSAVAVSCAGALAISRFAPTSRLSLKR